jgi:hypothetical protein
MKKLPARYLVIVLALVIPIFGFANNAIASVGGLETVTQLLKKQVLAFLPTELAGAIDNNGKIDPEAVLIKASQQGNSTVTKVIQDGFSSVRAGYVSDNLIKDAIEIAQNANNKSHKDSTDEFEQSAPQIERVVAENETESESSLQAADKANQLASASIATSQRQIKATSDLTTAVQIANVNAIGQAQANRVKNLRDRVDVAAYQADRFQTRANIIDRYYPDGTGSVQKVESGSSLAAFGGK